MAGLMFLDITGVQTRRWQQPGHGQRTADGKQLIPAGGAVAGYHDGLHPGQSRTTGYRFPIRVELLGIEMAMGIDPHAGIVPLGLN